MFDIGFAELAVIFIVALVVFGPEKLPKLVRTMGYWTGRAKATMSQLKYELEREAQNMEIMERYKDEMEQMGIEQNVSQTPLPPADTSDVEPSENDEPNR